LIFKNKIKNLSAGFAEKLDPFVHEKSFELHQAVEKTKG